MESRKDDLGQLPDHPHTPKFKSLPKRVISALVLAVVAIGAYLGGDIAFTTFSIILAGILLFELSGLQTSLFSTLRKMILVGFGCAALSATSIYLLQDNTNFNLVMMSIVLLAWGLAIIARFDYIVFLGSAAIYLAVVGMILTYLQAPLLFLLVVLLIVGTDIGGYVFGKIIGGPKILSGISPNKTWVGTIGGWVLAVLIFIGFVYLLDDYFPPTVLILMALGVSICSQIGDVLISMIKRRAGVKDSSNLLPGHGGFLDRFDGFIGAGVLIFFLHQVKYELIFGW